MKGISRVNFCVKVEIWEWQFSHSLWFYVKNLLSLAGFHVKLLKLRESGMNEKSWHRTEVKRESVKCWKMLSSVNFPWKWIHEPITRWYYLPICYLVNHLTWQIIHGYISGFFYVVWRWKHNTINGNWFIQRYNIFYRNTGFQFWPQLGFDQKTEKIEEKMFLKAM